MVLRLGFCCVITTTLSHESSLLFLIQEVAFLIHMLFQEAFVSVELPEGKMFRQELYD